MSQLLPSLQARDLEAGLVDFLALVDADARAGLEDFLRHDSEGISKGPYVSLRSPFRPAESAWQQHLDWTPQNFVPYGHQAAASARLTSKPALRQAQGTELRTPLPTLLTTGTGSGKTEALLFPVLD